MKRLFLGIALALALSGTTIFAREQIRAYTVPKERPAAQLDAAPSAPVTWKAPAGWEERAPGNMVIGNFAVPGKDGKSADVSITTFPGDVGGDLANVNRWRNQLGLTPVSEVGKSEDVTVGGASGKLYEISNDAATILVASIPRNGSTWFFKIKGDKETVADAKPAFSEFLKSIQFADSGDAATATDPHAGLPSGPGDSTDPHAGLNIPAATGSNPHADVATPSAEADSNGPAMDVPSTWKEKAPGPMVVKSYTITGSKGGSATVSISTFPGDVGGELANINRWRRQMGQPEIDDSQLKTVANSVETTGGTGYSIDIEGTDAKTGKPAQLVAAAIPNQGHTWFYKLLGDKNVVDESKAGFLKFVKSVRY